MTFVVLQLVYFRSAGISDDGGILQGTTSTAGRYKNMIWILFYCCIVIYIQRCSQLASVRFSRENMWLKNTEESTNQNNAVWAHVQENQCDRRNTSEHRAKVSGLGLGWSSDLSRGDLHHYKLNSVTMVTVAHAWMCAALLSLNSTVQYWDINVIHWQISCRLQ